MHMRSALGIGMQWRLRDVREQRLLRRHQRLVRDPGRVHVARLGLSALRGGCHGRLVRPFHGAAYGQRRPDEGRDALLRANQVGALSGGERFVGSTARGQSCETRVAHGMRPEANLKSAMEPIHVPIFFLIPTRKRPAKLRRSVDSVMRLATNAKRVFALLRVDDDDPTDYSAYAHVKRGPRMGYRGLHCYMNELAETACAMAPGESWHVIWNDDEIMLTPNWDEKLVAYGSGPKVVFLRRDCTAAVDTAYPAYPRSFFDLIGRVGVDAACDTWLAHLTGAADRLIGKTTTHVHALDIVVNHDRDENDHDNGSPALEVPDPGDAGIERDAFKLAAHHDAPGYSPPFGLDANRTPIVRR